MIKAILKYSLCFSMAFLFLACKKKTDIKVVVYNPITNTFKSDVTVFITQYNNKHVGTLAGARTWVQGGTVFSKVTDATGSIIVSDLKLKRGDNVRYQIHATPPSTVSSAVYLVDVIKAGEENNIKFEADW